MCQLGARGQVKVKLVPGSQQLGRSKKKNWGLIERKNEGDGGRKESRTFSPQSSLVFALARPLFSPSTESLEQVNKLLTFTFPR